MQTASSKAAIVLAALAVLSFGLVATSSAAQLNVGTPHLPVEAVNPPGAVRPSPGATLVAGGVPIPFSAFGLTYSGTLTSSVWANDTTNPYIGSNPNAKTFTYMLTNDASSINVLHRLTVGSYGGTPIILADVTYNASSPGVAPTVADRSTADVIGFTFADAHAQVPQLLGNIGPGMQSKILVVQTNATEFLPSFASVIDGSTTNVPSWAPIAQIPEPSTLVLAGLGVVGLAFGWARRRK
jgi:hypothetical protein